MALIFVIILVCFSMLAVLISLQLIQNKPTVMVSGNQLLSSSMRAYCFCTSAMISANCYSSSGGFMSSVMSSVSIVRKLRCISASSLSLPQMFSKQSSGSSEISFWYLVNRLSQFLGSVIISVTNALTWFYSFHSHRFSSGILPFFLSSSVGIWGSSEPIAGDLRNTTGSDLKNSSRSLLSIGLILDRDLIPSK